MRNQRFTSLLLLFALPFTLTGCAPKRALAPGQVWSYDTRSREGASTVQILHIERGTPLGDVYFVSIRALDVQRLGRKIRTTEIWPLAFTQEALTRSLTTFQWDQKVNRPYLKHLDFWLREAREGRSDQRTFRIPVKDALREVEQEKSEPQTYILSVA